MQIHESNTSDASSPAREKIVAAARRHFFADGFRNVTMDDLAQELGMSKKTLYAHFPSKIVVLQEVLHDKIRTIERDLDRLASEPPEDFFAALHRMLACIQQHTDEIGAPFLRDLRRDSPESFEIVEGRRREVIGRYFGKLLDDGRKAGLLRKEVSVRLVVEILLGAVQAIMNPEKMAELGLTPTAGYAAITTVVFRGVIADRQRPNA